MDNEKFKFELADSKVIIDRIKKYDAADDRMKRKAETHLSSLKTHIDDMKEFSGSLKGPDQAAAKAMLTSLQAMLPAATRNLQSDPANFNPLAGKINPTSRMFEGKGGAKYKKSFEDSKRASAKAFETGSKADHASALAIHLKAAADAPDVDLKRLHKGHADEHAFQVRPAWTPKKVAPMKAFAKSGK